MANYRCELHLQWYAAATQHFPQFWENDDITKYLHNQGNHDTYITTFLAHLPALAGTCFLVQRQFLSPLSFQNCPSEEVDYFTLDIHQKTIQQTFMILILRTISTLKIVIAVMLQLIFKQ